MNSRHLLLVAALSALSLAGCGPTPAPETPPAATDLAAEAARIAADSIIVDTHIDVPYRLRDEPADVSRATADGDFDYPRAKAGHLNAAFMSIYTPAGLEAEGRSYEVANQLIDGVESIVEAAPDKFAVAVSVDDVRRHFDAGLISLPLGMENGSPIDGDLGRLEHFYDRGIRYVTLAHGLSNHISDSSYDENRQWNGLSEFGREVVAEMNRLGIMIDVSHISDEAFWQVMDLSAVPAIASHSSARHFTPGWERNMADDMIRRLAEEGGVIMINFGSAFLKQDAREYGDLRRAAYREAREANPELNDEEIAALVSSTFEAEHGGYPYATLDDVLDHIDYVVGLSSVDAVGIGSDYDGVGDSLPEGLKDVSAYPNLVRGLLERGYSEGDIKKILGENLLRVWAEVEAYAASQADAA
ncbi:MAG: dipeptidase [Woeseiaceae bacterium]|jgi:membrane dipeptidase|nr:dipeptidase [Woeseiaceae bacterium]